MDYVKDIEKPMLLWVKKASQSSGETVYWGDPLAGTLGFGENNARAFHGRASCLGLRKQWRGQDVTVSRGHTSEGGRLGGSFLKINTHSQDNLPETPFLLTSLEQLRLVCQQEVAIDPADKWGELEEDSVHLEQIYLCCPEWLGILQVDKAKSKRRGIMMVFSDRPDVTMKAGQPLRFAENPDIVFGCVSPV